MVTLVFDMRTVDRIGVPPLSTVSTARPRYVRLSDLRPGLRLGLNPGQRAMTSIKNGCRGLSEDQSALSTAEYRIASAGQGKANGHEPGNQAIPRSGLAGR